MELRITKNQPGGWSVSFLVFAFVISTVQRKREPVHHFGSFFDVGNLQPLRVARPLSFLEDVLDLFYQGDVCLVHIWARGAGRLLGNALVDCVFGIT